MSLRPIILYSAIALATTLGACATPRPPQAAVRLPPEIQVLNRYPEKPSQALLTCPEEPVVPEGLANQGARIAEALAFTEAVLTAGETCRENLRALRLWIEAWPGGGN